MDTTLELTVRNGSGLTVFIAFLGAGGRKSIFAKFWPRPID